MEKHVKTIPVRVDSPTDSPDTDAVIEFDMLVSLIWFPFRVYIINGSTEFFSVEELVNGRERGGRNML
ncbi:hypothetical protein HanXRQr2_Chr04g0185671 [Helianthus annuus]|uniref:Uncharacterized protein n=1 Tax=Helianthus annuus TaxID=4232 RepID=A0A9K3NT92_HELAN|nr:hypothetical protein HanXRQr2_Chr04g0185671 [Helianthus annuus]KAJ0932925.1 hypothetical protein HanPSC8_Chr04g0179231 [Helianthus annuus]